MIAIGIACNALVIGLNLGMPVKGFEGARIDTTMKQQPAKDSDLLQFLGDIIVLPHPPFDESISFGDLILAVGLIDVAFWASRRRRTDVAVTANDGAAVPAGAAPEAIPAAVATAAVGAPATPVPDVVATPVPDVVATPVPDVVEPVAVEPDALPVDVPTSELPLPIEAVMVDDAAPARRPPLSMPGPVEEKVKQPVWDPNRTAPVPVINAAPAHADPAPPADTPSDEDAPTAPDDPEGGASASASGPADPSDPGVRTLWSAENDRDEPAPVAGPAPIPNGGAPTGELEGRRRRQGRRRRSTPQPPAQDPHQTHEIDLSAFEVRSDAGTARRAR